MLRSHAPAHAPSELPQDYSLLAPAFDAYVGAQLIGDGHWMPQEVAILTALLPVGGRRILRPGR